MITHLGIEVNLDQIKAINGLHPPQNPKTVQKLTGMTVGSFLGQQIDVGHYSSSFTSGKILSGPRNVLLHLKS